MELVAVLFSVLVSGVYGQWTGNSLTTACEDYIQPFPCPGLPCEECDSCISNYFYECKCVPQSFNSVYSDPDELHACWYFRLFWVEPRCCELYQGQMKRNGLMSEESADPFIGMLSNLAETNKRDNGKNRNSTTNTSASGINTSSVHLENNAMTEADDNQTDPLEEDLTDVDITENHADDAEEGTVTDSATQEDNHTGQSDNKDNTKDKGSGHGLTEYDSRKRRDSLLMQALMLTQDLLKAEGLLRDLHHRDRIK